MATKLRHAVVRELYPASKKRVCRLVVGSLRRRWQICSMRRLCSMSVTLLKPSDLAAACM